MQKKEEIKEEKKEAKAKKKKGKKKKQRQAAEQKEEAIERPQDFPIAAVPQNDLVLDIDPVNPPVVQPDFDLVIEKEVELENAITKNGRTTQFMGMILALVAYIYIYKTQDILSTLTEEEVSEDASADFDHHLRISILLSTSAWFTATFLNHFISGLKNACKRPKLNSIYDEETIEKLNHAVNTVNHIDDAQIGNLTRLKAMIQLTTTRSTFIEPILSNVANQNGVDKIQELEKKYLGLLHSNIRAYDLLSTLVPPVSMYIGGIIERNSGNIIEGNRVVLSGYAFWNAYVMMRAYHFNQERTDHSSEEVANILADFTSVGLEVDNNLKYVRPALIALRRFQSRLTPENMQGLHFFRNQNPGVVELVEVNQNPEGQQARRPQ